MLQMLREQSRVVFLVCFCPSAMISITDKTYSLQFQKSLIIFMFKCWFPCDIKGRIDAILIIQLCSSGIKAFPAFEWHLYFQGTASMVDIIARKTFWPSCLSQKHLVLDGSIIQNAKCFLLKFNAQCWPEATLTLTTEEGLKICQAE